MKTKKIIPALAIIMAVGTLTFTSCKKKTEEVVEEETPDTEQSSATDNSLSENIVSDIEAMGSEASENNSLTTFKMSGAQGISAAPCATVSIANKIITVDFGTNCVGSDGRTRSGKLIYNFSASPASAIYYRNPGFSMSVSSQNYVVDNYTVNINSKNVTNTTPGSLPSGPNPGTNLTWAVAANVAIIKPNSGGTITWVCNRTKELINTSDSTCYKGQSTFIRWNKAIVKLNGTASGTNASGESYTATATSLVRDFNCSPSVLHPNRHPFISGTILYTPGTRKPRLVDYGSGACDLNGTITINNNTYSFILP